jgi:hypothetical protein
VALGAVGEDDLDGGVLADEGVEGERAALGEQPEVEAEETGDALAPLEAAQEDYVLAERREDLYPSILLRERRRQVLRPPLPERVAAGGNTDETDADG